MKKHFMGLSILGLLAASVALAEGMPLVNVGGIAHKLVVKDVKNSQSYESDRGYCVSNGFSYAEYTMSQISSEGPYAILDRVGHVVQTFPSAGNENRFKVAIGIGCAN